MIYIIKYYDSSILHQFKVIIEGKIIVQNNIDKTIDNNEGGYAKL
jgi:hypothetical protein